MKRQMQETVKANRDFLKRGKRDANESEKKQLHEFYLSFGMMHQLLKRFAHVKRNLVTYEEIGRSVENRPIFVLKVTASKFSIPF
ncbi:hypothetical protein Ciccas_001484 [Cichlidogyrus casuarinus]|uniref:Peptidase M14 domain-containing protein n=1 Tax=Cichlidogyrus casuarinus TaxID=1844966 RepID=A0ABD2QK81_9PLAT